MADEYDAIVSKRQYKSHIDISETLQILADKTKPSTNDPKAKEPKYSKMNPKVVKALLKVVISDTEYEISSIFDYIEYLKTQIKRLEKIDNAYKKALNHKNDEEIAYYLKELSYQFEAGETIENYKSALEEYKTAKDRKQQAIDKLYDEIKKIKAIKI